MISIRACGLLATLAASFGQEAPSSAAMNGALSGDSCPVLEEDKFDEWSCRNITYGQPYCRWPPSPDYPGAARNVPHRRRRSLPDGNIPFPGYKCTIDGLSHDSGCVYWGLVWEEGVRQYEMNYPAPLLEKVCPLEASTGCRTSPNYPAMYDGWPCGGCYFWVNGWTNGIKVDALDIDSSYDSLLIVYSGGWETRQSLRSKADAIDSDPILVRWEPANWHHGDDPRGTGWKLCPKDDVKEPCTCETCADDPEYRYEPTDSLSLPCDHEKVHHYCNFKTSIGDIVRNACRQTCMTCSRDSVSFSYPRLEQPFRSASLMDFSYGPAWKESVAANPKAPWAPPKAEWRFGNLASGSRGPPWTSLNAIPGMCIPPERERMVAGSRCLSHRQCKSNWCCPLYKVCLRTLPLPGTMLDEAEIWLEDEDRPDANGGIAVWTNSQRRYTGRGDNQPSGWLNIAHTEPTCGGKAWPVGPSFFFGRCGDVVFDDDGSTGILLEDRVIWGRQYYAYNPTHPDCGCKIPFKEAFDRNAWTGFYDSGGVFRPLCPDPDENAVDCADGDTVKVREGCEMKEGTLKTISGAVATVTIAGKDKEVSIGDGIRKQIASPQQDLFCKVRCPGSLPEPWEERTEPWKEPIPVWYPWPPRHCVYTSRCQGLIEADLHDWVDSCIENGCSDYRKKISHDVFHQWAMEFCDNVCAPYVEDYCKTNTCAAENSTKEAERPPSPEEIAAKTPNTTQGQLTGKCPSLQPTITLPPSHELAYTGLSNTTALCAAYAPCPVPGEGKPGGALTLPAVVEGCAAAELSPTPAPPTPAKPTPSPTPGPFLAPTPAAAAAETVTGSMKVENVSYTGLVADAALRTKFEDAIKSTVAAEAGAGILPEHVSVELSAGSVVVDYTVTPPAGVAASGVVSKLSSAPLAKKTVEAVSAVPQIASVSEGTIAVSDVSSPAVETAEPDDEKRGEPTKAPANGGLASAARLWTPRRLLPLAVLPLFICNGAS
mmetsp:Transcript_78880/g.218208  ORF Transcript_78880/g.218208 Transcript_78880/m.218208 type:complete len:993 (-) Transcript_78880:226-3204(-)